MFSRKQVERACLSFANLGVKKQKLLQFLLKQPNGVFVGSYTTIAKQLGLKVGTSGSQGSVRKGFLELEEKGLVVIGKRGRYWEYIRLEKDWLNRLSTVELSTAEAEEK